ncbi:MAG: acetyltransferase [Candidatus Thermoplasmatota archaeon]|jgi:sugar O-acyltransferase (sialic acid O-acetyltransferase NeuD family)|nr:acetyltransferase [Candidatus Thermoplasmatota archaeon]
MIKLGVIGAGGLGRETIMVVEHINLIDDKFNIIGFFDDNQKLHGTTINGYQIIGGSDWIVQNRAEDIRYVIGIGDPHIKKQIVDKLSEHSIKFETIIHPSVKINENVEIGEGTVITANCILTVNITVGNHVFLNLSSTVGHDAIIEDYCNINPLCAINGGNILRTGVTLGTGAKLIQNVTIGKWSTIGAGAVVINDIPEYSTAVGIPAKVIKIKGVLS